MNIRDLFSSRKFDDKGTKQTTDIDQNLLLVNEALNHYPDPVFTVAEQGSILSINQAFTRQFGYHLKDLKQTLQHYIASDDHEKFEYHWYKVFAKQPTTGTFTVIHHSGKRVDVEITLIPVMVDEEVEAVQAVAKDLSDLRTKESELLAVKRYLDEAEKVANIGSWDYDIKNDRGIWSTQIYEIFQIADPASVTPNVETLMSFIHPDDRQLVDQTIERSIDEIESKIFEHRIVRRDGQVREVLVRAEPITDENGQVVRLFGTIQDITEKKQIESTVKEQSGQLELITNNLDVGIWSYDVISEKLTVTSKGMERIFATDADTLKSKDKGWTIYVHPDDSGKVDANVKKMLEGQSIRHQYRIINAKNEEKWIDNQSNPVFDDDGNVIRLDGVVSDITKQKSTELLLDYLAHYDQLTKLPNRQTFIEKLDEWMASGQKRFAVLHLNLERFKFINDTLGYEVGDQLLTLISNRLNKTVEQKAFLARIGGDEFALGLPNIKSTEETFELAKSIINTIEKPLFVEDYELYVTTSIGISFYPIDGKDAQSLFKNASIALHKAKEDGTSAWNVFSPVLNIESFKQYSLEKDLRKAFMNDEFFLEYQPKVDPKTEVIKGAEALIRWEHPEWGQVSPAEFLPLAEESGLNTRMSDWVFEQVCQQINIWEKQGYELVPISINVSPNRLLMPGFVSDVFAVIKNTGIDPKWIELEITEETIIKNIETAKSVVKELKEAGIKLSLDDFCSGYSSLSYLNELDIDSFKFDKSFIANLTEDNKKTRGIIKSLLVLADELELTVVAEGVETNEQLTFLRQRECPLIQGYIYSKSVPAARFAPMLKNKILKATSALAAKTQIENRRKFYRINFTNPLASTMTIVQFKGNNVQLGKSRSLIEDMSLGGLRFTAEINLPVRSDVILEFTTKILGEEISVRGFIVWKQEAHEDLFQYGLQFITTEKERDKLAPLFNKLTLDLKKNPLHPDCDFIHEGRMSYFKREE
ncbi:EAL domain-containing protein [Desertibacillus haloalkaliphilus]|uniref:EAL domain-containing protein n=1 Tax=Desertibacillus haloalkaliphilus TaxID=1328930 RepID=UPI001C256430|nr:EAL domain-containing protein [Desertibacillus haloalkaliphilus]MBU8905320.1 EAL domain-containing protein [Desertibacillus haloalkaliphilus]